MCFYTLQAGRSLLFRVSIYEFSFAGLEAFQQRMPDSSYVKLFKRLMPSIDFAAVASVAFDGISTSATIKLQPFTPPRDSNTV